MTGWLLLAGATTGMSMSAPWAGAALATVLLMGVGSWLGRVVLLRSGRSVTAFEWTSGREWFVHLGRCGRRLPAVPCHGCQRLGFQLWILRFDTAEGRLEALLDTSRHDPAVIRGLSRCLAATIAPKV